MPWERILKEITEIGPEKLEVEGQGLKSLIVQRVRKGNWVSKEMETELQATAADKVTEGTGNSCNQLVMARGIETLEMVKWEGHLFVGKACLAQVG